jgi:3-oxoacyl-[acyl-carrier protein] reductase
MDLGLKDKVVLITGGSSGIGLGVAQQFAADGAKIFICARRAEPLKVAEETIRSAGAKDVASAQADVTSPKDLDRLVDAVTKRFGRIDILINNAGTGIYKPFLDVTDDDLVRGMEVNFFAQFRLAQRVVPIMQRQNEGSIVNVSGCSGLMVLEPPFFSTCTGPAKAAEIRFTKSLAAEVGKFNIRVNCIAPNYVVTPERFEMWKRTIGANEGLDDVALQQKWGARIALPDHRWCTIEEAAKTIVFVASPAASYMTGSVVIVDGGFDRG